MKIGLRLLLDGKIQINRKILDFFDFEIRNIISSNFVKEKSLECAKKIVSDPYFKEKEFLEAARKNYENLKERCDFLAPDAKSSTESALCRMWKENGVNRCLIKIPNHEDSKEAKESCYHETIHLYLKTYKEITGDILFRRTANPLVNEVHEIFNDIKRGKKVQEFDDIWGEYYLFADFVLERGGHFEKWSWDEISGKLSEKYVEEMITKRLTKYYLT